MYNSMQIKLIITCNFEQMVLKYIFTADNSHYLADFEAKHLFKVCRLADEEQIKGPAPAEVGHNDCIDGHGGEELPPRGLEFLFKLKRESAARTAPGVVT